MVNKEKLAELAKLVRYYILRMTTKAGSGHATSSLSACDIMVALFFNVLRFDLKNPENPANDRVIFSKGHASPLLYALYAAAGVISEKELDTYRQFQSPLEGHPNPRFKYVEVATGSLGQGISIGLGMALAVRQATRNQKLETRNLPKVYVLMGDSEMSEGSVWEAMEIASYYRRSLSANKVGNLVGIIDVNRLGQSGETMLGWDIGTYRKRVESFGWKAQVINGHSFGEINKAFAQLDKSDRPQMIIAKTIKGKGVSFLENKEGWHGKALSEEDFVKALEELGEIDRMVRGEVARPSSQLTVHSSRSKVSAGKLKVGYKLGEMIATRKAYGEALAKLGEVDERIVALDGEVSNSTFSEIFRDKFPKRYFEMFIAEQNMVGVALGMSKRGYVPFVSTFAAFLTRANDQIRMSAYSRANVKFMGSHAGVSIGEDGPSQMGLEDIAMFRAVFGSVVMCPADAVSCAKIVELAAAGEGLFYIRTARVATPVIYGRNEEFEVGGSKVVRSSKDDKLTIVACGVTVHEAIKAAGELAKDGINVRVVDAYSIKPIDGETLVQCARQTNQIVVTIEDHYFDGGLGDAVLNVFASQNFSHSRSEVKESPGSHSGSVQVYKLAVSKMPMSGRGDELLEFEGISSDGIVKSVKEILA